MDNQTQGGIVWLNKLNFNNFVNFILINKLIVNVNYSITLISNVKFWRYFCLKKAYQKNTK